MSALAQHQGLVATGAASAAVPYVVNRTAFNQNTQVSIGLNYGTPAPGNLLLAFFAAPMEIAPSSSGWTKITGKAGIAGDIRNALQVFAKIAGGSGNNFSVENAPPWVPMEAAAVGLEIGGVDVLSKVRADIALIAGGNEFASPSLVVDGNGPVLWLSVGSWKPLTREIESRVALFPANLPKSNRSVHSVYVSGQYGSMPGLACAEVATEGAALHPATYMTDNPSALALAVTVGIRG